MATELKILNLAFRPLSDQEDEENDDVNMDGGDQDMDGEDAEDEDGAEKAGDFPEKEEEEA